METAITFWRQGSTKLIKCHCVRMVEISEAQRKGIQLDHMAVMINLDNGRHQRDRINKGINLEAEFHCSLRMFAPQMDTETVITAAAPDGTVPQQPEPHLSEDQWGRRAWELLQKLRSRAPLIQCITNFVSMDLMANVLLAAGASPAMLASLNEISDFTPGVDALCINIGTLSEDGLASMRAAAAVAVEAGRPWVLDPVAVSASDFRMEACLGLLELRPAVIRGNASEILGLVSARRIRNDKGVDSSHQSLDAVEAAKSLSQSSGAIVAVSGAVDYITDGRTVVGGRNGVAMLQKITGTGCAVTALIAAFIAVEPSDTLKATACALSVFGVAAEVGMEMATGPASLRMHLIDSLHGLNEHELVSRMSVFRVS